MVRWGCFYQIFLSSLWEKNILCSVLITNGKLYYLYFKNHCSLKKKQKKKNSTWKYTTIFMLKIKLAFVQSKMNICFITLLYKKGNKMQPNKILKQANYSYVQVWFYKTKLFLFSNNPFFFFLGTFFLLNLLYYFLFPSHLSLRMGFYVFVGIHTRSHVWARHLDNHETDRWNM